MNLTLTSRRATFIGRLFLCAASLATYASAYAEDDEGTKTNRWTIVFYDPSSPNVVDTINESKNETKKFFEEFVKTLQAREREMQDDASSAVDAPSNVVVFSPFESSEERKTTETNAAALLEWIGNSDKPSDALNLPKMRSDPTEPVDLRLFVDVAVRGTNVVFDGKTGKIKPQDFFKATKSTDQSVIERVALFKNLREQVQTRGANAVSISDDEDFDKQEEEDSDVDESLSNFSQSFVEMTFQTTSSEDFFHLLNEALIGYADVYGGVSGSDGVISPSELVDYLRFSSRFDNPQLGLSEDCNYEMYRLGDETKDRLAEERRVPSALFLRIAKRISTFDKATSEEKAMSEEALERSKYDLRNWTVDDFKAAGFRSSQNDKLESPGKIENIKIIKDKVQITSGKTSKSVYAKLSDVRKVADKKNKERKVRK